MKQKYVPLEKRTKKQQKEFHRTQRKDWGNVNPATKKLPNAKAYNRKKARQWECKHEPMSGFFVCWEIALQFRCSLSEKKWQSHFLVLPQN